MSDDLDKDWRDRLASVARAVVSVAPYVGGPLAELVTKTIPRLRQDRIVEYLRLLDKRLARLERERIDRILADPEKVDLIESGGFLAARATSSDRISRIAEVVFRGLESDEVSLVRRKRLLGLFGELDDDEFLLLNAYGQSYGEAGSEAWDAVDRPSPAHLGSSQEELSEAKLYDLGGEHLLRLGLLQRHFGHVKKGEYPPFDPRSGGFQSRIEISYLGRILLKEAGVELPS